jgi:hypothetical protein
MKRSWVQHDIRCRYVVVLMTRIDALCGSQRAVWRVAISKRVRTEWEDEEECDGFKRSEGKWNGHI